jgi:histidinol dehydrogenase
VLTFTQQGLEAMAGDVRVLAQKEGLTAHAASVDVRLQSE